MEFGNTNILKYMGVLITFLAFSGIFYMIYSPIDSDLPYSVGEFQKSQEDDNAVIEQESTADSPPETMAMMRVDESSTKADSADSRTSGVSSIPMQAVWIILLSLAGTMLSWTAVEQVVKKRNNVLLVTLDDEGSEKVMQALTNKTCRQILDILKDTELTESQIAKKLKMSLPRVHYNLKALTEAGLVETESFRYSEKRREMDIYTLTNKYIVIAPHEKKEDQL